MLKKLAGFILGGGGDKITLPAADGASGQVLETDGAGNLDWVAQGGSTIFGTEYTYAESLGSTTNGTTTYVEKLNLTTPSVPAGDYYIGWSYQWNYDTVQRDFIARVQLDDATNLTLHIEGPSDAGSDQKHQACGDSVNTLTAGVHTVDIDFAAASSGDVATIWNARLIFYRVS